MNFCKTAVVSIFLIALGSPVATADGDVSGHRLTIQDLSDPYRSAECEVPADSSDALVLEVRSTVTEFGVRRSVADGWIAIYDDAGSLLGQAYLEAMNKSLAPGAYRARVDSAGFLEAPWLETRRFRLCSSARQRELDKGVGGAIEGVVTEAGTGEPIFVGSVNIFDAAGSTLGFAGLNEAGAYSFGELAAGTYFARTESTGFLDELWDDLPCAQRVCVVTSGSPIVVTSGPVTADFALDQGGTISGTVTAAGTGTPITEGWVNIFDASGVTLGIAFLDGSGGYLYGGLAAGTYYARTESTGFLDELWDDLPCVQGDCVVTSGSAIVVTSGVVTADFALDAGGEISGTVMEVGTGIPIAQGSVKIHDDVGSTVGVASLGEGGFYAYSGLAAGTYFERTESTGFLDELWDDIPCVDGACVVTSGSPIVVTTGASTANFALDVGGTISGTVTAVGTGTPITVGSVKIFDNVGSVIAVAFLDGSGAYAYSGLDAGTYYARTESTGFFDELWDDLPCAQGACVATSGSPIVVAAGSVTADYALDPGGTISGTVTMLGTGTPITDGWVKIFDAVGSTVGLASLDEGGFYAYGGLDLGTYYARTESSGFSDELWDDIPCAQGACVATSGTPIAIANNVATADFALGANGPVEIFSDGFETGDTSFWSSVVGKVP